MGTMGAKHNHLSVTQYEVCWQKASCFCEEKLQVIGNNANCKTNFQMQKLR